MYTDHIEDKIQYNLRRAARAEFAACAALGLVFGLIVAIYASL